MAAVDSGEVRAGGHRRSPTWARVSFYLLLFAWNAYFLGGIAYTIWMRHHPNVQAGQNNVVLSLLFDLLVVGNLVILGLGFIVYRLIRRRRSSAST